jgi:hypothetical protein
MSPDPLFDFTLPVKLRAFIALWQLPAMGFRAVREVGLVPVLYGHVENEPMRIVAAFQDGSIGVSAEDNEFGTYTRISPYAIQNVTTEVMK